MSEFRNGLRGTLACACYTLRLRLILGTFLPYTRGRFDWAGKVTIALATLNGIPTYRFRDEHLVYAALEYGAFTLPQNSHSHSYL